MNNIQNRQVEKDDLDQCYKVESTSYFGPEADSRKQIERRINMFPEGFLVAEIQNEIIGIINGAVTESNKFPDGILDMIGHEPKARNIAICSVAVLPSFQGKGIAKKLISSFIKLSEKLGKKKIVLICRKELIVFYERFGFEYLGKSKLRYEGVEWFDMRMELKV